MSDTQLVTDQPGKLAAAANAETLARVMHYPEGNPAETPVTYMLVAGQSLGQQFWVGEGKFASAVFADAMCSNAESDRIVVTPNVIDVMRQFMGEQVMAEAEDPNSDKHPFVRAMLRYFMMGHTELVIRRKQLH